MKKVLCVSLLAVCSSAAVFAVTVLNLLVFFFTLSLPAAVLAGFIAAIVLGFVSSRFLRLFKRKSQLGTRWFILASYAPSAISAAVYWIVFFILRSSGYFTGYFAGLWEGIFGISLAPTAFCYLIFGTAWSMSAQNADCS